MSLQGIQNRLAVAGQTLQNIGQAITSKLHGMVVSAGQALKQLGSIIAMPFQAIARTLNSRNVEQQNSPERRNSDPQPHMPGRESELDSILNGMESIHIDGDFFDEELHVEPQPRDTLPNGPSVEVLNYSIEDHSVEPQKSKNVVKTVVQAEIAPTKAEKTYTFSGHLEQLKGKGMKSGEEAVSGSGLVPEHVDKFKSVAKETNTILMFRPVNQMSTGLLQEGTAAKGLNVHGKSSDWGPMAGYIAKDQNLCKKHDDETAIAKGLEDNQHSLDHDSERVGSSQLDLTENRLNYLLEKKLMVPCDEQGKPLDKSPESGLRFFLNGSDNNNQNYLFMLEPSGNGFAVSYKSAEGKEPKVGLPVNDWTPLEVMGGKTKDNPTPIPLTADYDMFAMLPKMGDGGLIGKQLGEVPGSERMKELRRDLQEARKLYAETKSPESRKTCIRLGLAIALQTRKEGGGFMKVVNQARTQLLGQEQRREIDPELGRLTNWQKEMRVKLNSSVQGEGGYTGGDLIKHGTEMDNTQFSEMDKQVFIIMPNGDTFMTETWTQTQAFMWAAKQDDFLTYTNRSYVTENDKLNLKGELGQKSFYPGQKEQGELANKFNNKRLDFDLLAAAKELKLEMLN